ncbi:MAG: VLRF1 family aeRF1-type release factor [Acidobacteriota bacterium]
MKNIDLRKLSELTSPDRAFLTIYSSGNKKSEDILDNLTSRKKVLKNNDDEYLHFNENFKLVENDLKKKPEEKKSFVIFCCWALDYYKKYELGPEVEDIIRIDSSPYILPIAQLRDEYEDHIIITATNEKTKIYLVSAQKNIQEEKIEGDIKNHVKVGGWSQQRYERRRDKEFSRYTKNISEKVKEMLKGSNLRRIIMVGSKETIKELSEAFPGEIREKIAGEKAVDLKKGEDFLNAEIFKLLWEEERRSEKEMWGLVKRRFFSGELSVNGIKDVIYFLKRGRVDKVIVDKDIEYSGIRCRQCEELTPEEADICPKCGSTSVFKVDLKNEIVELLELSGGDIEFASGIEELKELDGIAALLRY